MTKDFHHPKPRRYLARKNSHQPRTRNMPELSLFGSNPPPEVAAATIGHWPKKKRAKDHRPFVPPELAGFFPNDRHYEGQRSYDGRPYAKEALRAQITRRNPLETPPPCFFFKQCHTLSEVEKQGKTLCKPCAAKLPGTTYPLRKPSEHPPYASTAEISYAMGERWDF